MSAKNQPVILREQELIFRSLLENSTEMISLVDDTGLILFQSPSILRIMGYPAEERVGQYIHDNIHPSDKAIQSGLLQQIREEPGLTLTMQIRLQKKDKTYIWVESSFTNHVNIPEVNAIIVNERDVTEQWKLRNQIQKLNTELEKRVALRTSQLETANKELEAFSYSVSHDLRAPLRAISGFSMMLLEDYGNRLDEEGRRIIGVIVSNARMMGQLIDDLLAFSRVGRMSVVHNTVDMRQSVDSCLDLLLPGDTKEKYHIDIPFLGSCPGDPGMIRQVWMNLLGNAIKYSARKEHAVIKILLQEEDTRYIYSIRDNGVGFDMAYADKLFGVFQRLHPSDEFEGTGVGLALVNRIVRKHGGETWAEGEVGAGATFYFSIPK